MIRDNKIQYSSASKKDWNSLAVFRNIYSHEGLEKSKSQFARNFHSDAKIVPREIFKAVKGGQIVGYGRCEFFDPALGSTLYGLGEELAKGIYLSGVLVHEDVRGMGVGIELTNLRIEWARERADRIYCYIQETNIPSLDMHMKLGFKQIQKDLRYPTDSKEERTGVLLELRLL